MKKLSLSLIALGMFTIVGCGEGDNESNGNSDEVNMYCKCKDAAEESDECKAYREKIQEEFVLADENGKAELEQKWTEMDVMCNQ